MLANVQQRTIKPIIKAAVTEGTLIHTDQYAVSCSIRHHGLVPMGRVVRLPS